VTNTKQTWSQWKHFFSVIAKQLEFNPKHSLMSIITEFKQ